mmetsp:Transcript_10863/g.24934  ORF Transcript_10863/g.24934 Transcript_10863/m.24934 type:complete len:629 (-) Transcript_10863:215-2101(-)
MASAPANGCTWLYDADSGFVPCSAARSRELEEHYRRWQNSNGETGAALQIQFGSHTYSIDFEQMIQVNTTTGKRRPLKREAGINAQQVTSKAAPNLGPKPTAKPAAMRQHVAVSSSSTEQTRHDNVMVQVQAAMKQHEVDLLRKANCRLQGELRLLHRTHAKVLDKQVRLKRKEERAKKRKRDEFEHRENASEQWVWQFQKAHSEKWQTYDAKQAEQVVLLHERWRTHGRQEKDKWYSINDRFQVDFSAMAQRSLRSGKTRKIRCIAVKVDAATVLDLQAEVATLKRRCKEQLQNQQQEQQQKQLQQSEQQKRLLAAQAFLQSSGLFAERQVASLRGVAGMIAVAKRSPGEPDLKHWSRHFVLGSQAAEKVHSDMAQKMSGALVNLLGDLPTPQVSSTGKIPAASLDFELIRHMFLKSIVSHKLCKKSSEWCEKADVDVVGVEFVDIPPNVYQNYAEQCKRLAQKSDIKFEPAFGRESVWRPCTSTDAAKEFFMFHGTKWKSVDGICRNGFDGKFACKSTSNRFGQAMYFATNASKSDQYTDKDAEGQRCIFMVRVALGRCFPSWQKCQALAEPPPGFDSISGVRKEFGGCVDQNEVAMFNPEACLPCLKIIYKHKAGCRCSVCKQGK